MKSIRKSMAGGSSLVLMASILGFCVFAFGCKSSKTIWSEESHSPDGKVVASVHAVARNQGLSIISGVDSSVYLNWATGPKQPMLVLELADASDAPVDTHVDMSWPTPNHLELTYKGKQTVVFQAVKWVDINITVRNLSSSTTSAVQ